jgi:uncharacterized membrane protein
MEHATNYQGLQGRGAVPTPAVRSVDFWRPLDWLRLGWADFSRLPKLSCIFGALIAGFGLFLLALVWRASYLAPAFIGGFLLVAPFVAIGLYDLARQLEAGRASVASDHASFAWRSNRGSIALFGLALALALILWERVAAIVFALSFGGVVPDLGNLVQDLLFSGQHRALLLAFVGAGAVFAILVFAFSVVTAPMLLDRPVDIVTAAITSLRCCLRNPLPLLLWAVLIVLLTGIGFATATLGLVVIFPWLGYASWHAYRDLVEPPPADA